MFNVKYFILLVFLSYLFLGTGIHSDDYALIEKTLDSSFKEFLLPDLSAIHVSIINPLAYLHYQTQFFFFEYNYMYYDLMKICTVFFSMILIKEFLKDFVSDNKAFMISSLFVLYPTHDATNYWTTAQFYILVFAVLMYGFKLVNNNQLKMGFLVTLVGNFISYNTPPISFGLSIYFLLKKEYKKFIVFILPQILYIGYYFIITTVFQFSKGRLDSQFDILSVIKQYILQVGTFIDASIGPSFWLKIYYSIMELTVVSIVIGITLVGLFYKYYNCKKDKVDIYLLISFIMITLFAFGIFSLTGLYPQIAFNLGNRVTIFGSLFVSFIIVMFLMNNKKTATLVFAISLFSILGISDHWKAWNSTQLQIIENISTNKDLKEFDSSKQIFVTYNQFSMLGNISHIEFFTEGISNSIFRLATNKDYKVSTLNKRFIYKNNYIFDKKHGTKIKIKDSIYIYNSKDNKLIEIKKENIQAYIDNLPKDNRHWLQLLDKDNIIMKIVLTLMPRLAYAI